MDLPLIDFLDEAACYRKLIELLHPEGGPVPHAVIGIVWV